MKLNLIKEYIVDSSFYNQFKQLYVGLLLTIKVQIIDHVKTSTTMWSAYQSYLNDFKANGKPEAASKAYLEGKHAEMDDNI
jgi:hypothetical protein